MDSNPASIIEKLTKAWRFFYQRGFIEGFGHISARSTAPGQFYLSRHSLGIKTQPEDFLLMDLEGRLLSGKGSPPGEFPIHTEIYRKRPDVGSILHFHGLYCTAFTMSSRTLRPCYFLSSIFRDGIPLHPDSRLVSSKERGESMVRTLEKHRAVLLKAHGVVVTGKDIEEMVANSFILEDNAHRTWVSASLGEPVELDPEVMAEVEEEFLKNRGPFGRIWALCESEAKEGGKE